MKKILTVILLSLFFGQLIQAQEFRWLALEKTNVQMWFGVQGSISF